MASFFEFRQQMMSPRRTKMVEPPPGQRDSAMSVGDFTKLIDGAIKSGVPSSIVVRGELSNVKLQQSSGHLYFTLKDANACVDCVMWRSARERMKLEVTDGEDVLVTGSVAVFAQRGRYQLYATRVDPIGRGALEAAFRKLCAKLEAEGLFAPDRKRPIPIYPTHLTLITSRQTAALQDMLKVLRRFAWLKLSIFHVPVQGSGAAEQIAAAITAIDSATRQPGGNHRCDVVLLARGGGSLEDLWAFSEECVARAMAAASVPIVTGIGHEIDTSVADLVADYHAHTPTEAAQVVTTAWRTAIDSIELNQLRMNRALRTAFDSARQRLFSIERHELFRRPTDRIERLRQRLDDYAKRSDSALAGRAQRLRTRVLQLDRRLEQSLAVGARRTRDRLTRLETRLALRSPESLVRMNRSRIASIDAQLLVAMRHVLRREAANLSARQGRLDALSPLAVLSRGFSITTRKRNGAVVRSAADVKPGDAILTRTAHGEFESTVEDAKQSRLFGE